MALERSFDQRGKERNSYELRTMPRMINLFLIVPLALFGVSQVRDNPRKPVHPDAGRVLGLVEVQRIKGEDQAYFFEGARDLEIDSAGNLYVCDSWSSARKSRLLKFSPEGKFIKDLYRQGEGPGEILSIYDFGLSGSELYLYDMMKRKIVVMDTDGSFKAEFRKETSPFSDLLGVWRDWLVFLRADHPLERKTSRLYDVRNVIILVSKDGKTEKELCAFTNQRFYISLAQGGGAMNWDPFHAVIGGDQMFVCSAQNYEIQILDLETAKVFTSFKRDYPRVDHVARDWEKKFASEHNAPKRNHENDVNDLHFGGGFLWVLTSTESKDKGFLYDLFDANGKFEDSFFVNLRGRILKIDGKFLFASISDENSLPLLVKYRITEPIGAR